MEPFTDRNVARKWAQYKYPQKFAQGVIVQRLFGGLLSNAPGWHNVDVITNKVLP